jgi:hypothetical protein
MTKIICSGGLANESLFAIILYCYKELESSDKVISAITHITDWSRMTSATSPHIFKYANEKDIKFIDTELEKNKYSMFIRKISPEFPNEILREYIYQKYKDCDNNLILKEPIVFIVSKIKNRIYFYAPYMIIIIILYKYLF